MSQSLAQLYVHIVFSTKSRQPFLTDPIFRTRVHACLAGIRINADSPAILVGGSRKNTTSRNLSKRNFGACARGLASIWTNGTSGNESLSWGTLTEFQILLPIVTQGALAALATLGFVGELLQSSQRGALANLVA